MLRLLQSNQCRKPQQQVKMETFHWSLKAKRAVAPLLRAKAPHYSHIIHRITASTENRALRPCNQERLSIGLVVQTASTRRHKARLYRRDLCPQVRSPNR